MAINEAFRYKQPLDFTPTEDDFQDNTGTVGDITNPPPRNGLIDAYKQISQDMKPGPATQAYRDFLTSQPDRNNYKPGKSQKLAAVLTGISEGVRDGAAKGMAAQKAVLDEPYNNAMSDWKTRADRMATAANEEEKDISNRVKTYRDFLTDKERQDTADETKRYHTGQLEIGNRRANNEEQRLKNQGWNFTTRTTDGHRIATKINPINPNGYDILDLGKFGESADEKDTRGLADFSKKANITLGRQKNLFDYEEPTRLANQKEMVDYRESYKLTDAERKRMEKLATDKNSPNREYGILSLALRDVIDKDPDAAKKGWFGSDAPINLKTMTWKPEIDKEVQDAISKRRAQFDKVTTTKSTNNNSNTKPSNSNGNSGSSNNQAVVLKDKNGKEWNVNPQDVPAFKKANGLQ